MCFASICPLLHPLRFLRRTVRARTETLDVVVGFFLFFFLHLPLPELIIAILHERYIITPDPGLTRPSADNCAFLIRGLSTSA